ncbi:hypothetical protein BpHYR1_040029 [Brachionus plicatilis]|uniref:Uncharacterized protein n=1 Tax=Brachionus plicatilis TaxID=10195 RepID=A0A3M7T1D2_BRAPC|nr:hypothetical protein BpHYR1_040029 [Brachionus plicatilis]
MTIENFVLSVQIRDLGVSKNVAKNKTKLRLNLIQEWFKEILKTLQYEKFIITSLPPVVNRVRPYWFKRLVEIFITLKL